MHNIEVVPAWCVAVNFRAKLSSALQIFVAFVENNATMSSISYFENHVLLERSPGLSNNGEFKRQTASEIAIKIYSFSGNCSDTQSVSS